MPSRPKRSIRQVDLGAANTVHTHTESDITDLDHTDDSAIHDNVSGEIAAITAKTTPVDADVLLIEDSAATNAKKKLSWSNVKATLKTYFDALYAAVSHSHTEADITDLDHYTDTDANAAIDARVNKAFVDALNVDADTLDGEHASAFADAVHSHELDELDATAITDGHVLTAQGDGTAAWEAPVTGVTDHGALTGLSDDDHPQYLTEGRLAALPGYRFGGTVYFTSSGTFEKADYPGLRAVRVKVQAGGGGGGGCMAADATRGASAGGGGGGGYVEAFILVDSLGDLETVTVGTGGAGGPAGNNDGSAGGGSSFGAHAVASGGGGGRGSGITVGNSQIPPGDGGNAPTGDIRIRGDFGGYGMIQGGNGLLTGFGGGSFLGGSVRPGDTGQNGIHYGGGGSGARNATGAGVARAGGDGAPGIVIVELYY